MWLECANNAVQYTPIVENDQILLVPKYKRKIETT